MTPNRRNVLTGIGALGVASVVGVGAAGADSHDGDDGSEDDSDEDSQARVRVAHLSPDAPNVDVYIDDEQVLSDVAFRSVSHYLGVAAGTYTVKITAAGDPDTVPFEDHVTVESGTDYTLAAIGELSEDTFEVRVLVDEPAHLPDDVAKVRVVHASPDAPAVDVSTDAAPSPLATGVEFGDVGSYYLTLTGEASVSVTPADADDADPVAEPTLTIEGGATYTLFAAGYLSPDDEPTDESFGIVPAVSTPRDVPGPNDALVRAAHLSPDAPNVDVYLDDDRVLSDVSFGTISDYRIVRGDTYGVRVTPAGEPDTAVIHQEVTVDAGGTYTVAATGELDDDSITATVLTDDRSVESGHSKVKVLHASPDAPDVDVTVGDGSTTLADDLAFGHASDYSTVDPGDYTAAVAAADGDGEPVATADLSLEADTVYTVAAAGYLSPDDEPAHEELRLIPAGYGQ